MDVLTRQLTAGRFDRWLQNEGGKTKLCLHKGDKTFPIEHRLMVILTRNLVKWYVYKLLLLFLFTFFFLLNLKVVVNLCEENVECGKHVCLFTSCTTIMSSSHNLTTAVISLLTFLLSVHGSKSELCLCSASEKKIKLIKASPGSVLTVTLYIIQDQAVYFPPNSNKETSNGMNYPLALMFQQTLLC